MADYMWILNLSPKCALISVCRYFFVVYLTQSCLILEGEKNQFYIIYVFLDISPSALHDSSDRIGFLKTAK